MGILDIIAWCAGTAIAVSSIWIGVGQFLLKSRWERAWQRQVKAQWADERTRYEQRLASIEAKSGEEKVKRADASAFAAVTNALRAYQTSQYRSGLLNHKAQQLANLLEPLKREGRDLSPWLGLLSEIQAEADEINLTLREDLLKAAPAIFRTEELDRVWKSFMAESDAVFSIHEPNAASKELVDRLLGLTEQTQQELAAVAIEVYGSPDPEAW